MLGADVDLIRSGEGDRERRPAAWVVACAVGPESGRRPKFLATDVFVNGLPIKGPGRNACTPVPGVDHIKGEVEAFTG